MIHENYIAIMSVLESYGLLTAREISEYTGIDRSNVYMYLEELEDVGWVVKERGSLMDIQPVFRYLLSARGYVFLDGLKN